MMAKTSEIKPLLNDFFLNLSALNRCMKKDKEYFLTQDVLALELSNEEKTVINANLENIRHQLSQLHLFPQASPDDFIMKTSPMDLFDALTAYAKTLDSVTSKEYLELISNVREEYITGIELLHQNRHVVNANLSYIKEIVHHLTQGALPLKAETYNEAGVIG